MNTGVGIRAIGLSHRASSSAINDALRRKAAANDRVVEVRDSAAHVGQKRTTLVDYALRLRAVANDTVVRGARLGCPRGLEACPRRARSARQRARRARLERGPLAALCPALTGAPPDRLRELRGVHREAVRLLAAVHEGESARRRSARSLDRAGSSPQGRTRSAGRRSAS